MVLLIQESSAVIGGREMRILFVCTGNTCRSPMAEALFREKVKALDMEVRSAGVAAFTGDRTSSSAQQVLEERGIYDFHAAKRLDHNLIAWAELVLTMTEGQRRMIVEVFPAAADRVFTLKEYVGGQTHGDIFDPFGDNLRTYRKCAQEIEQALDQLLAKLMPTHQNLC